MTKQHHTDNSFLSIAKDLMPTAVFPAIEPCVSLVWKLVIPKSTEDR